MSPASLWQAHFPLSPKGKPSVSQLLLLLLASWSPEDRRNKRCKASEASSDGESDLPLAFLAEGRILLEVCCR